MTSPSALEDVRAIAWAETVLRVLGTDYPYGTGHVTRGPDDVEVRPATLHPAFHGSLDWHSSAHMQWSALRLLDRVPAEAGDRLTAVLSERLTGPNLAVEADYLRRNPGYERPYGWAWALMLAAEAERADRADRGNWVEALQPLTDVVVDHLSAWLPRLAYPVRHGVHANTAFALTLCWDARPELRPMITERAVGWFGGDRDAPAAYEPSGEDFVSPVLTEADLVRRVLPAETFVDWLTAFLPGLGAPDDHLLEVPVVLDRTDGKAVHLFGLALSRAGQLRRLAPFLTADRAERCRTAATAQLAAVGPEINRGDFMSTHWLVSFALLAEE